MTLKVLSEDEVEEISKILKSSKINHPSHFGKASLWTDEEMQKALNTIKLQRQQLAEQERKVWNEAIKLAERVAYTKLNVGQVLSLDFKALLKPESEVSGE